jgi:aldose 1-epimerase
MALISIESSDLKLGVVPEAGGSVTGLWARIAGDWVPILRPTPADAIASGNSSLFASFALVPWSNRVRDARFSFGGRAYELRANTPEGHAIHGDVRKRPWKTGASGRSRLELSFDSRDFTDVNFPFPFTAAMSFTLDGRSVTTEIHLRNEAREAMPAGFGFHPYFRRTVLDAADDVELEMSVAGIYRDLLPTSAAVAVGPHEDFRRMRPIAGATFDHCFAGWDGRAAIRWPKSGVEAVIEATEPFRHVILFVPPGKDFFAVEPVSHANDGFNLLARGVTSSGMRTLAPGETLAGSFRIAIAI